MAERADSPEPQEPASESPAEPPPAPTTPTSSDLASGPVDDVHAAADADASAVRHALREPDWLGPMRESAEDDEHASRAVKLWEAFYGLKCLDASVKERLRRRVADCIKTTTDQARARAAGTPEALLGCFMGLGLAPWIASVIVRPFWCLGEHSAMWTVIRHNPWWAFLFAPAHFVLFTLGIKAAFWLVEKSLQARAIHPVAVWVAPLPIGIAAAGGTILTRNTQPLPGTAGIFLAYLLVLTMFAVWLWALAQMAMIVAYLAQTLRQAHEPFPSESAVVSLLEALDCLEQSRCEWSDFGLRQRMMDRIESIARRVEYVLLDKVHSGDPQTTAWLRDRGRGVAWGVRRLKRLLLTDQNEAQLLTKMADTFVHLVVGDWAALPWSKPPPLPQRWRLGPALRALALAALIAALWAVFLASPFRHHLPEKYLPTAWVVVIVWVVVCVVAAVDPTLVDRLEQLQERLGAAPAVALPLQILLSLFSLSRKKQDQRQESSSPLP